MRTRKIEVQFLYDEAVVPPGCRSERAHERMGTCTAELAEPEPDEAPVALVARTPGEDPVEYRLFDHEFYAKDGQPLRPKTYAGECFFRVGLLEHPREGFEEMPVGKGLPITYAAGIRAEDEGRRRIRSWSRSRIVVDGELWEVAKEPVYHTDCDGGLTIEPDIFWLDSFSAAEEDAARAKAAEELADHAARSEVRDPQKVAERSMATAIDVLIPNAVAKPRRGEIARMRSLKAEAEALTETLEAAGRAGLGEIDPGLLARIEAAAGEKRDALDAYARQLAGRYGRGSELDEGGLGLAAESVLLY